MDFWKEWNELTVVKMWNYSIEWKFSVSIFTLAVPTFLCAFKNKIILFSRSFAATRNNAQAVLVLIVPFWFFLQPKTSKWASLTRRYTTIFNIYIGLCIIIIAVIRIRIECAHNTALYPPNRSSRSLTNPIVDEIFISPFTLGATFSVR